MSVKKDKINNQMKKILYIDMDNVNYCKFNVTDNCLDKALDDAHLGPKTHRKFAEDIISEYGEYLK